MHDLDEELSDDVVDKHDAFLGYAQLWFHLLQHSEDVGLEGGGVEYSSVARLASNTFGSARLSLTCGHRLLLLRSGGLGTAYNVVKIMNISLPLFFSEVISYEEEIFSLPLTICRLSFPTLSTFLGIGAVVVIVGVGGTTTIFCSTVAAFPGLALLEGVACLGEGGVTDLAGDLGAALVLLFFEFITLERD